MNLSPSGPRLPPGETVTITLGPRRLAYPDDRFYFQRENQRYYGKVISVYDERYIAKKAVRPHPAIRRVCTMEIIT